MLTAAHPVGAASATRRQPADSMDVVGALDGVQIEIAHDSIAVWRSPEALSVAQNLIKRKINI
jgi:hypothetical protein